MRLKKIEEKTNVDLGCLTTLKVGGKAKYFFTVRDISDLSKLLRLLDGSFYILGGGSNLLIEDRTIKKPVIKLSGQFQKIEKKGRLLEAGSSILLSFLLEYCIRNNLSGLENLAGMPASVGGMLATGASSFGTSIYDCLKEAEVIDGSGEVYRVKKDKIDQGYRYSSLKSVLILKGCFKFMTKAEDVGGRIKSVMNKRCTFQDFSLPSCGSVFKNPDGASAGRLIENAGLKGKQRGKIKISEKHANFILNLGKGAYQDADYLINSMRESVYKQRGIMLEEEIQRWR